MPTLPELLVRLRCFVFGHCWQRRNSVPTDAASERLFGLVHCFCRRCGAARYLPIELAPKERTHEWPA